MDNQTLPNIPPIQPLPQTPITSSANFSKILFFIIFGLIVIAGSVFAGIQIGKNQITKQQLITEQPTISPTQTVVNQVIIPTTILTIEPSSTTNPTADWKTYINKDLGISFNYPKNWKIIDDQGPMYVSLYPPESDPKLPSDNIAFYRKDQSYIPEPTPNNCMTPFKSYIVGNVTGRITEDEPLSNKCFPRTGGCSSIVNIELPLRDKTLTISYCARDRIRSEEVIKTLKVAE